MSLTTKQTIALVLGAGAITFSVYKVYKVVKKEKELRLIQEEINEKSEKELKGKDFEKEYSEVKKITEKYIDSLYRNRSTEEILADRQSMLLEEEELALQEEIRRVETYYDEVVETVMSNPIAVDTAATEKVNAAIHDAYITDYPEELNYTEEEIELIYEPNSDEALVQFIEMKLAPIENHSVRDILYRLYQIEFKVDETIIKDGYFRDTLVMERQSFFGDESIHCKKVTLGDVYLYFAYLTNFDDGRNTVEQWVKLFLDNSGLTDHSSNMIIGDRISKLVTHRLVYNGFGMFGLETDQLEEVMRKNKETTGDDRLTFMSQYHIFINNALER